MPNFVSIHLSHSDDMEDVHTFLISEDQPGVRAHKGHAALAVLQSQGQHFAAMGRRVDGFSVNGKQLELNSFVKDAPDGKVIAVLDSGATLAQVPPEVDDLIYGSIPDAFFLEDESTRLVQCTSYSNVTFAFGCQYAIHPLDLTVVKNITLDDGSAGTFCTSGYNPFTLDGSFTARFVSAQCLRFVRHCLKLADSTLFHVLSTSFNYGKMDKNGKIVGDPYIQLLTTTDRNDTVGEFQKYRTEALKKFPPQVSTKELRQVFSDESDDDDDDSDSMVAQGSLAASGCASDSSALVDRLNKYGPVVVGLLAGSFLVGVVLLLIGLAFCVRRGGKTRKEDTTVPTSHREIDKTSGAHEHAPLNYND